VDKVQFSVNRKGGFHSVCTTLAPSNRSQQTRLGLVDLMVITFFVLLCAGGLVMILRW